MPDFTELDSDIITAVSRCVGEYIDSLGKTDLNLFTAEEWDKLIKVAYHTSKVPF